MSGVLSNHGHTENKSHQKALPQLSPISLNPLASLSLMTSGGSHLPLVHGTPPPEHGLYPPTPSCSGTFYCHGWLLPSPGGFPLALSML